jgi:hypothetical protein
MGQADRENAGRTPKATLQMKTFDVAALQRAHMGT